jgi:hypothetical protein
VGNAINFYPEHTVLLTTAHLTIEKKKTQILGLFLQRQSYIIISFLEKLILGKNTEADSSLIYINIV